jgi:ribosomal protein S5
MPFCSDRCGVYNGGGYAGYGYGANIAYRTAYQDGMRKAREDMDRNKPFNASRAESMTTEITVTSENMNRGPHDSRPL